MHQRQQGHPREDGKPTFTEQCLRDLLSLLSPAHETDGDGDTLFGEETVVVLVCDVPYLAEHSRCELCTAEYSDCDVAGEDAYLLCVCLGKDLVDEGELWGCWGEMRGHGADERDVMAVYKLNARIGRVIQAGGKTAHPETAVCVQLPAQERMKKSRRLADVTDYSRYN